MKKRVFISFDYDHDASIKDLLVGQAKNPDSPFEIADWSIKKASSDWEENAHRRIRACDLVIVLCGRHTESATGVDKELRIAYEENTPYLLLRGYSDGYIERPIAGFLDDIHPWTWPILKALIGSC